MINMNIKINFILQLLTLHFSLGLSIVLHITSSFYKSFKKTFINFTNTFPRFTVYVLLSLNNEGEE